MTEVTLDSLKEMIVEKLQVDETKITEDASFIDDLGADSLDTVELIMSLEDKYEISIPDDDAEGLKTVGDVLRYLQNKA